GLFQPGRLQPDLPCRARIASGGVPQVCTRCEGLCAVAQRHSVPSRRCWLYGEPTGGIGDEASAVNLGQRHAAAAGPNAASLRAAAPAARLCWPRGTPPDPHASRSQRSAREGGNEMSTTQAERPQAAYALGRTPEEYDRLRMQARVWEIATGRLLDR